MTADLQPPSASDLLLAWERGRRDEFGRADALLAALGVEESEARLVPLGRRNRLLLAAHLLLFGPVVEVVGACSACAEELEVEVTLRALLAELAEGPEVVEPVTVHTRGHHVQLSLPRPVDLEDLPGDVDAAARVLLTRCVVAASRGEVNVEPPRLPAAVVKAVDAALAAADPGASLELAASCPGCGAVTELVLDPAGLLWAEVDAWAWRVLAEVHALAEAYGWGEHDVLAMTPTRRQAYLHLCGAGEGAA